MSSIEPNRSEQNQNTNSDLENHAQKSNALIRALPTDVVNQIAAGEVVERPSHLVKELIENSIDAGASEIRVEVDREARTFRVQDDGHGIRADELPLALERHATSKISKSDDLFGLVSFGFRGEALASMAAVSMLTISSKFQNAERAFEINSQFGKLKDVVPSSLTKGTEIFIQSLFENVPARLKFLKTASHEISQIRSVIKAMALANPNVQFKFHVGGELDLFFAKQDKKFEEILGVKKLFSKEATSEQGFSCKIVFASPVEVAKTSRNIWIFVQGRWVQDRTIQAAIMDAYRSLLMHGEYPQCAVFVSVPPDFVDVNIHPTKSQIKFVDSSKIYRLVQSTLRDALSEAPWFRGAVPVQNETEISPAQNLSWVRNYAPGANSELRTSQQSQLFASEMTQLKTKDYSMLSVPDFDQKTETQNTSEASFWGRLHVIGQHDLTYIVCQKDDELVLVDQHAAHERVAFEKLMQKWRGGKIDQQSFLFPLSIQLSEERVEALIAAQLDIEKMGIELERLGPSTIGIRSAPVFVKEKALVASMERLSEELCAQGASVAFEKCLTDIFATMACHSVVRAGQSLSNQEMKALLAEMDEFPFSSFCPHGRPVSVTWGRSEIERLFGRRPN